MQNQSGSIISIVIVLAVLSYGGYFLYSRLQKIEVPTAGPTAISPQDNADSAPAESKIVSFQAVNNYNAEGKISFSIVNGRHQVAISAALPNEFEKTKYFAYLADGTERLSLGTLRKESGLHKLTYSSARPLDHFTQAIVYVDGDSAVQSVENKPLPHDVLSAALNN